MLPWAERRVWRRSLISGRPSRSINCVVELASWPIRSAASPAWRIATRASASVAAISGERSASERLTCLEIVEDAGDRFLVAVGEQFGQPLGQRRDAFEQLRRGVEQLAERARPGRDDRHAIGAFGLRVLLGAAYLAARRAACARRARRRRRIELDLRDAGEADAADRRGRALEHRRLVVDDDAHADELRAVRHRG